MLQAVRIAYSSGEDVYMAVTGRGAELNVGMEPGVLVMDPTYVTLFSQKNVKLYNNGDEPVRFDFRALQDEAHEGRARARLVQEIPSTLPPGASAALIEQREDEIADLPLHFVDDVFTIEPVQGEVWPGCTRDIVVTFSPVEAVDTTVFAYLEIAGKESRQPLQLQGSGVGAQLFLSHTVLVPPPHMPSVSQS